MKTMRKSESESVLHIYLNVDRFRDAISLEELPRSTEDSDDILMVHLNIDRVLATVPTTVHSSLWKKAFYPCTENKLEKCLQEKFEEALGPIFSKLSVLLSETLMYSLLQAKEPYSPFVQETLLELFQKENQQRKDQKNNNK